MRSTRLGMLLLVLAVFVLAATCVQGSWAAAASPDEISKLEKLCGADDNPRVKAQFDLIRQSLEGKPASTHEGIYRDLLAKTQWGTIERATMCYVCAWYGVDYARCRDYVLNITFWYDRGHERKGKPEPESWSDVGVDMLYALYEHNLDFQLLHALITGPCDAGNATAVLGCVDDAANRHPRGLLHVAEISRNGKLFISNLLAGKGWAGEEFDEDSKRAFVAYIRRVAADSKDPLCKTAESLLRGAAKVGRAGKAR